MDKFSIEGGAILSGTVAAGGSKNAALPILFAAILADKPVEFQRVPRLKDIDTTLELLRGVGAQAQFTGASTVIVHLPMLTSCEAPYDLVRTMRASVLMLGPLLARERKAKVSLPGGCAIGSRPVDLHLSGLEKMGAQVRLEQGYICAEVPGGLKGAQIDFRMPSVGATENLLMAATFAQGETVLNNAAREPEIVDLARFLRALGADISGEGSSVIRVRGVNSLRGASYPIMFDRIESATLLLAGPITKGKTRVIGVDAECLTDFLSKLKHTGLRVSTGSDWMEAEYVGAEHGIQFVTEPYPGYPTDLQAQLMAYLAQMNAQSEISETIFENRFMHVPELNRLGADIRVEGSKAVVHGKSGCYQGATVMATDLRASASLVLAGLAAKGLTQVRRIYHLDRGYEGMESKLVHLGAKVRREIE